VDSRELAGLSRTMSGVRIYNGVADTVRPYKSMASTEPVPLRMIQSTEIQSTGIMSKQ